VPAPEPSSHGLANLACNALERDHAVPATRANGRIPAVDAPIDRRDASAVAALELMRTYLDRGSVGHDD
jgi:hypothetical protein